MLIAGDGCSRGGPVVERSRLTALRARTRAAAPERPALTVRTRHAETLRDLTELLVGLPPLLFALLTHGDEFTA